MLGRWDPFRDMNVLQDRINRLFNEQTANQPESASNRAWAPVVDVIETQGELIVRAELPGLKKDDIEIQMTGESLTISGERKFDEANKDNFIRVERPYGRFSRSFTIGVPVQSDKVSASYTDGILEVVVPKAEEVKPKKIEIAAG